MRKSEPFSKIINWICDECGKLNQTIGSRHPRTFLLRYKYAKCQHCLTARTPYEPKSGYFQCTVCNVVYRQTKTWTPIKGQCRCCFKRIKKEKQHG